MFNNKYHEQARALQVWIKREANTNKFSKSLPKEMTVQTQRTKRSRGGEQRSSEGGTYRKWPEAPAHGESVRERWLPLRVRLQMWADRTKRRPSTANVTPTNSIF